MLTVDISTLKADELNRVHMLEFDMEHGHVQVFGEGGVYLYPPRRGTGPTLESGATGGCYSKPQMIADVQLWNAEEHFLAIFPDEASMRVGGRQLAREWGDELPVGIHRIVA
jgi:hypothetical protein